MIRREWVEYVAADYAAVILGPIRNTVIFLKNLVITKLQPNLAYSEISPGQIRFEKTFESFGYMSELYLSSTVKIQFMIQRKVSPIF